MARSRIAEMVLVSGLVAAASSLTVACDAGPSKNAALEAASREGKSEALCTLPIEILSSLKMQHATKAACVPKDAATTARSTGCMEALATAHLTEAMPESYMREWPDDVAARGLDELPASARKSRELAFAGCWAVDERLRQGQFICAEASPDKVLGITKIDDAHAEVKLSRELAPIGSLSEIDRACGGVTRPASDVTVRLEKISTGWAVANATPFVGH